VRAKENHVVFSQTDPETKLRRRDHLTFKGNRSQGRHGWLRLTPAYSLHLVQDLVAGLSEDDIVLDPFCGTGTTALACAQHKITCDTVDVNPFLVWLASAKCARYSEAAIQQAQLFAQQTAAHELDGSGAWAPPIQDIHKWWSEPTLHALSGLFARISEEKDPRTRDLLRIAFCRAAIETAAVSFGHQSMSFRRAAPQPTLFNEPASDQVLSHFGRAVSDVATSATDQPVGTARVVLGDSRDLAQFLSPDRYTRVITSPPYPNRMSYIRELRPYMYWLGYLTDGRQAGELDWKAIGGTWGCATSLVAKWEPNPKIEIPWKGFHACVKAIKEHSDLLGRYVHKYFEDAVLHINALVRVLASGARVHYVVGNSKFYDVLLPTEEIYASLFVAAGMSDVSVERIRKRTSKKELFEFVVHAKQDQA
jgi:hypothetical protein